MNCLGFYGIKYWQTIGCGSKGFISLWSLTKLLRYWVRCWIKGICTVPCFYYCISSCYLIEGCKLVDFLNISLCNYSFITCIFDFVIVSSSCLGILVSLYKNKQRNKEHRKLLKLLHHLLQPTHFPGLFCSLAIWPVYVNSVCTLPWERSATLPGPITYTAKKCWLFFSFPNISNWLFPWEGDTFSESSSISHMISYFKDRIIIRFSSIYLEQ